MKAELVQFARHGIMRGETEYWVIEDELPVYFSAGTGKGKGMQPAENGCV